MGYRSDVRVIIKTNSLEILKQYFSKQEDYLKDLIEKADIHKTVADITYLGWNEIKADMVDTIEDSMMELGNNKKSYRMTTIGENMDDISSIEYTTDEDYKHFMPYPSITREFDEKDIETQLNGYLYEYNHSEEMEQIDYE